MLHSFLPLWFINEYCLIQPVIYNFTSIILVFEHCSPTKASPLQWFHQITQLDIKTSGHPTILYHKNTHTSFSFHADVNMCKGIFHKVKFPRNHNSEGNKIKSIFSFTTYPHPIRLLINKSKHLLISTTSFECKS
jgi:hypothetical protein